MSNSHETTDSNYWHEAKTTTKLGWPIIGAQLLWLSMVFVDNLLVARLGTAPLAALAIASGLFGLFSILLMGACSAVASLISASLANEDWRGVQLSAKQGIVIATAISALTALCIPISDEILVLLGQDGALAQTARSYLLALVPGLFFSGLYLALRQIVEGHHDTKPSFVIAAVAAVFNFFLDHALVFGWGPIPAYGIEGAGYATSIVSMVMASLFLAYVLWHPRYRQLTILRWEGYIRWSETLKVLRLGLPMAGAMMAEMAFFVGATFLMGTLGEQTLAAHQIAINAASFTFMIPLGMSFAVTIRIGHHYGSSNLAGLRRSTVVGVSLALCIALHLSGFFLLFPDFIAGWYTHDPQLIEAARHLLIAAGLFQIFDCLQVTGMGILRGLQLGKAALINTMVSFWCIGFPAAWYMGQPNNLGALGIWYGLILGLALASICHMARISRSLSQQPLKNFIKNFRTELSTP